MKEFIKNCNYFTFSIFKYESTEILFNFLKQTKGNKEINNIFEFNYYFNQFEQTASGITKRKVYFFTNEKGNLIMIGNKEDGLYTLAYKLSKELAFDFYQISISNNKTSDPKNELLFEKNGKLVRVIRAMKDPKWFFYEEGEPLWFENLDYYKNRYIKDRLNKEIIIEYCYKLGFEILNEDFWCAEKALFLEYL
ncbi:MAG: hypothetical protein Q4B95_10200 [Lonepinella koalarum]|nr:hypothetical protein [Lonepinella koalarum]